MPRARSLLSSHAPRSSSTQCASAALPSRSSPQHALTSLYPAPCQSAGQIRHTHDAACAPTVGGRASPRRATALRVVLAGRSGRELCLSDGLPPHRAARRLRGLHALSGGGGARLSGGGRGVPPPPPALPPPASSVPGPTSTSRRATTSSSELPASSSHSRLRTLPSTSCSFSSARFQPPSHVHAHVACDMCMCMCMSVGTCWPTSCRSSCLSCGNASSSSTTLPTEASPCRRTQPHERPSLLAP